ncbi:AraC family transcriptional regulator [Burkholderia gladioli]|uniref:AraC family transcriptional regulator n=1 Tax=Burkholderia gladioli TaxID=28095 RepID=UPI0013E04F08|nr:AraC family transcriptional regulator [Burkholderia gladioli]MBU9324178.1 AraC family transcriptional regulator [Burkholderia gladioli]MDN7807969.1 AraC family transcriptional regulator [Burkholderia gladioli]
MDATRTLSNPDMHMAQADGRAPAFLALGRSPAEHGVAIAAMRFAGAAHLAGRSGEHLVNFHLSAPSTLRCAIADHRLAHRAHAGSLSICPAGVDCSVEAGTDVEVMSLVLSSECLSFESLRAGRASPRLVERLSGRDDRLLQLARLLLAETASGFPNGALHWSSISQHILDHLATHHLVAPLAPAAGTLDRPTLSRLDDYIQARIAEPICLPDLASIAGCGRFHFTRLFRRGTGMTPHRYVMRLRVAHALGLLRATALPLADVAAASGFADQSHLSRWMRQIHGFAPGALRGEPRPSA